MRVRDPLGGTMRGRLAGSLSTAILGAAAGFMVAKWTLDPELFERSQLPAMYATTGAIIGVLTVRVAGLLRSLLGDYFGKGSK